MDGEFIRELRRRQKAEEEMARSSVRASVIGESPGGSIEEEVTENIVVTTGHDNQCILNDRKEIVQLPDGRTHIVKTTTIRRDVYGDGDEKDIFISCDNCEKIVAASSIVGQCACFLIRPCRRKSLCRKCAVIGPEPSNNGQEPNTAIIYCSKHYFWIVRPVALFKKFIYFLEQIDENGKK